MGGGWVLAVSRVGHGGFVRHFVGVVKGVALEWRQALPAPGVSRPGRAAGGGRTAPPEVDGGDAAVPPCRAGAGESCRWGASLRARRVRTEGAANSKARERSRRARSVAPYRRDRRGVEERFRPLHADGAGAARRPHRVNELAGGRGVPPYSARNDTVLSSPVRPLNADASHDSQVG